ALRQKVAKALIGIFRRAEAGELAHGPEPPAMHGGVNAARVRRLAWEAQVAVRMPTSKISVGVKAPDGISGNSGEFGLALGTFFKRRPKGVFFPSPFLGRRLARGHGSVAGRNGSSFDLVAHVQSLPTRGLWDGMSKGTEKSM